MAGQAGDRYRAYRRDPTIEGARIRRGISRVGAGSSQRAVPQRHLRGSFTAVRRMTKDTDLRSTREGIRSRTGRAEIVRGA